MRSKINKPGIKKIILLVCFLFFPMSTFAIDGKVEVRYNLFLKKVEAKYSEEIQRDIFLSLRDRLNDFTQWNITDRKRGLAEDMIGLNNESLYNSWLQEKQQQSKQKLVELRIRKLLENDLEQKDIPSFIRDLANSSGKQYIPINSEREFLDGDTIQRIDYTNYFPIEVSNTRAFRNKDGIIVQGEDGWYRFIEDYSFEEKIPYSELGDLYGGLIIDTFRVREKWGIYYWYNFTKFRFYEDRYWAYEAQMTASDFPKSTLIYLDENGRYNFITEYTEEKLVSTTEVFWVSEKQLLLDYLREDSKSPNSNMGQVLGSIEDITKNITKGKTREEKIRAIYNWILENIEYSPVIDLNNEAIFSAIETFNNREWVCTGYTKLSSYMFYFAGIHDAEVIRGHVIDAQDFPQIGHAWVRIGDKYYDPTFDDPIGATNTKKPEEYLYYWLPRDIFYANRYDYGDLPEEIETASIQEREEHIYDYLQNLLPKYGNTAEQYLLFREPLFYKKYSIPYGSILTPEFLSSQIGSYEVQDSTYRFTQDGQTKQISSLRFYPLTNENIPTVLKSLNYNLDGKYLFKWKFPDGSEEWRLAYEIVFR